MEFLSCRQHACNEPFSDYSEYFNSRSFIKIWYIRQRGGTMRLLFSDCCLTSCNPSDVDNGTVVLFFGEHVSIPSTLPAQKVSTLYRTPLATPYLVFLDVWHLLCLRLERGSSRGMWLYTQAVVSSKFLRQVTSTVVFLHYNRLHSKTSSKNMTF